MVSIERTKRKIRTIIRVSKVPEDARHAENTLQWLLRLDPEADQALQIGALAHDIDRAVEARKMDRSNYEDYDAFKAAHAHNGAQILDEIMDEYGMPKTIADEVCRLVRLHKVGGDSRSDLLKDADSLSYFHINMPLYYEREGREEAKRRCIWGYHRLSASIREIVENVAYEDDKLTQLLREAIRGKAPTRRIRLALHGNLSAARKPP